MTQMGYSRGQSVPAETLTGFFHEGQAQAQPTWNAGATGMSMSRKGRQGEDDGSQRAVLSGAI